MAVKTDVSKAYDTVEWNFFETTLKLFGFCDKWVGWIMATNQSRSWNSSKITSMITDGDGELLNKLHLSIVETEDKLIWNYSLSGEYTVKSGYWFLRHDPHAVDVNRLDIHGSKDLKQQIWRLRLMTKIKHFLWRVVSRALPTTTRLRSRGMTIEAICPRCRQEDETILHALFTCPFAKKARNNSIFNDYREGASKTVLLSIAETKEWINISTVSVHRDSRHSPVINSSPWIPPIFPIKKCNFDAGFDIVNHTVTGGWIVRDHHGKELIWGATKLTDAEKSLEAEAKALILALEQTWQQGYGAVIFEGDNESLCKLINGSYNNASLSNLLQDIIDHKHYVEPVMVPEWLVLPLCNDIS
ncbi:PREDICTED: uncharacterized protein LOC109129501 [Camelina sativa]|uniref:Uncharacterized protein LOC109129501 n=1 Tax=Camelina sativa TaxID=90675 RepID=A0ABM1R2S1_CAMSA|nr:PREDICTED: uncharacterized protein LOC109129501 [Camelina sativa]